MSVPEALLERPSQDSLIGLDFETGLIDADAIPELYDARQKALQEALGILATNTQLVADGQVESAPLEVNVLGTAKRYVEAKRLHGENSPQCRELDKALMLDSERAIGEAERKMSWELFPEAPQPFDAETEHYSAHGVPMPEILAAGLTPFASSEQQDRRVNEYVEDMGGYSGISRMLRRGLGGIALQEGETVTAYNISECTDEAIEEYKTNKELGINPKDAYRGLVPQIEKFMIRDVTFDALANRVERQLGLSGEHITHDVIMAVLAKLRVIEEGQELTKTELHSKQLIDLSSRGLIWFAELLDIEASEQSGKRIFMGEEVDDDHPMDYESVPIEAETRRIKLAPKPRQLADHLTKLQENDVDPEIAEGLVNAYLKEMLLEVASNDPDKAEVMFDKKTADGFKAVAFLKELGHGQEASRLQAEVERNAPDVSYCGAGSCGLEAVGIMDKDGAKARELGLDGKLLHDKERACPECNKKKIHYDLKGNKACTGCDYRKVNGRTIKPTKKSKKDENTK